jgi:hypothetical protein
MRGMKLNKLTLLYYWYAIAALLHPRPRCRCSFFTRHRWDKIGSWKAKLEDHEMADAVPNTAQLEVEGSSQSSGTTGTLPLPCIVVACSASRFGRPALLRAVRVPVAFSWCIAAADSDSALPDPEHPGDGEPIATRARAVLPRTPNVLALLRHFVP